MSRLILGSRGSDLALAQSRQVASALESAHGGLTVVVKVIHSRADKFQDIPLSKLGGKGLFTKELELALLSGEIDLAVHSLKDLPTELPNGLCLACVPRRENPQDALITRGGVRLDGLRESAIIGTSSLRRKVQLLALRPDLQLVDLRGNVPTRIAKIEREGLDGIVLAMAGLRRLGLDFEVSQELTPELMLPAPAQGALGIEARAGDEPVLQLLARLHDPETARAVAAERALLRTLGGGCQTPVGALATVEDGQLRLRACVGRTDATQLLRVDLRGELNAPEGLGTQAAEELFRQGADSLLAHTVLPSEPLAALSGKRVLVTRSSAQASKLSDELRARGADVLELPTIDIQYSDPGFAIGAASEYDWLLFTSANGVEGFAQTLSSSLRSVDEFRACRICAIGPATAEALRQRGFTVDLMPPQYVAEAIAPELSAVEGGLRGKRILALRGNLARPELPEALRALGAAVVEAVVYHTLPARPDSQLVQEVGSNPPDYVTFTSSSTVSNFCALFPPEKLSAIAERAVIVSIGPVTSGTCAELGLRVGVQPRDHTIEALVHAMVLHATAGD